MYKFPTDTHPHLIFFSDLDGTLLDHHNYSWEPAHQALERLSELRVALILSTSKTLAELRVLAHELHNQYPCIVENGGGIAWPDAVAGSYMVEPLSQGRPKLLQVLEPLHQRYRFRSCQQMDVREFAALTGLTEPEAGRAMDRQFSEPMLWQDDPGRMVDFAAEVEREQLSLLRGGRFLHLMGAADKGRAMDKVVQRWATGRENYRTVALGDSYNDVAMLERADIAVVARSPVHPPPEFFGRGARRVTDLQGPAGWNKAVLDILKEEQG